MRQAAFHAMGTTVSLLVPVRDIDEATEVCRTLFEEWESTLSRFRPESELSRLNRTTGQPVAVSELLFTVTATALEAARTTGGLYDPTLHDQMVRVGYDRSFETLPPRMRPVSGPLLPGGLWRAIELDAARRQITLPVGAALDFGGIAKGMAVDAALERLRALRIENVLVNAGGDLSISGLPPGQPDWPISVPGKDRYWVVPFHHGAMATSGIARRHWQQGPLARHHLLDPRTGEPAQSGLWSVTVAAARCAHAEVAAKVAFILGPDRGAAFLREHAIAGLLIFETGEWRAVGSWPLATLEHTL